MSANTNPIHPLVPQNPATTVANADGTTKKTVLTAGTNGTRLDSLHICSDDTAQTLLNFYLNAGSSDSFIGQVAIPAGAGSGSTSWQEGLATLNSNLAMALAAGAILKVAANAAVTSGKTVTIVAFAGDY
jgi:hypothetical protein